MGGWWVACSNLVSALGFHWVFELGLDKKLKLVSSPGYNFFGLFLKAPKQSS